MKSPLIRTKALNKADIRLGLYRKRYAIPNAVTMGSFFCGFLSIIYSGNGRFHESMIAIALGILLDGVDGRVARRLNATSPFGVEFDSFADLISFGLAPAFLMYHWCFKVNHQADEFGVLVVFAYFMCTAIRLARFNVADPDLHSFTGLPSPGAAAAMVTFVNLISIPFESPLFLILMTMYTISIGGLMISRVPYVSIKQVKVEKLKTLSRLVMGLLIALIWYDSRLGGFVVAYGYAMSGLVMRVVNRWKMPVIVEEST